MRLIWLLPLIGACYYELSTSEEGATQPGLIEVAPAGLVMTPGSARRLTPVLLTSDSMMVPSQPTFSFVSSDETIAKASATGEIEAIAEGDASIEVGDGEHGITLVDISVRSVLPTGPVLLTCTPSVIVVPVGGRVTPVIAVVDAQGNALPLSSVTLNIDTSIATTNGVMIDGVARGTTVLTAVAPGGTPLLGSCTVFVGATPSGTGGQACLPERDVGCWTVKAPRWMSTPGLSQPVRVSQITTQWTGACQATRINVIQVPPDSVSFSVPGVATTFGGSIVGSAPGTTNVRITRAGQVCGEGRLTVGVDLGGEWSVSCANEDKGTVVLGPTPRSIAVSRQDAWSPSGGGGRTESLLVRSRGNSTFCGRDGFSCGGEASGSVAIVGPPSGGPGRCGSCRGAGISDCASSRHAGPTTLEGPDRIVSGDCTYTRGSQKLECSVSACATRGTPCFGTDITFCLEDNACFYEISGMRFPCASCQNITGCATQAADYAQQRCEGS